MQCQTLNEEEIYAVHDEKSLFPVGWIDQYYAYVVQLVEPTYMYSY